MGNIEIINGNASIVETNNDSIEPNQYFKVLKSKLGKQDKDKLQSQLNVIAEQIVRAKEVGQKNFLEKLAFTYETIVKEQELLVLGYDTYVLKGDIINLISNVKPKNSVKIIELERYQRVIPIDVLEKIKDVKEKNLFDDFCVVFTDFTDEKYQTKEEQDLIKRNKDPIVFGYFKNKKAGFRHDRFYFIADWIDDNCDLDFSSMVEKMSKIGIKNPSHKINTDSTYINEIIASVNEEINKSTNPVFVSMRDDGKSFWDRLKEWFK